MAHSGALVEVLKRELKTRGVTYAQVARKLGLSEASVKRMFSRREFTLKRIAREFSELHNDDVRLPPSQRLNMTMLVAIRHWELLAFTELRRKKPPSTSGNR